MSFRGGGITWHDNLVLVEIDGLVNGPGGEPLEGAMLRLWGSVLEGEAYTDNTGYFYLKASTREGSCMLYAFHDDPETTGIDLLPEARAVDTSSDTVATINFTLASAATVIITGQLRPVEMAKDVTQFTYKVIMPEMTGSINSGDRPLVYGTDPQAFSHRLDLNKSTVLVPAERSFAIVVSPYASYQRRRDPFWWAKSESTSPYEAFTEFALTEDGGFTLGRGEVLRIDVEEYSLRSDLKTVRLLTEEIEANITNIEKMGFYTTSERHELRESRELIESVSVRGESGAWEGCYLDLRRAYLKLQNVADRIYSMKGEAAVSLNVLIAFSALTSVALAALLTESRRFRILVSACAYAPITLYLRSVYPGGGIVASDRFLWTILISFAVVALAVYVMPRAFVKSLGYGAITRMGTLTSVFSIANRSLRRRKLRSLLTFSSILTLTMSFVALTSLSTGYGLIYRPAGSSAPDASGIMVRMAEYEPENQFQNGWFNYMIPSIAEWARGTTGVVGVAVKGESVPDSRPVTSLGGWPIRGVMGVQPEKEPLMPMIDGSVVAGEPLREEGTCLVHIFMLETAGVEVGDSITVAGIPLSVVGAFDDGISQVIDMDGEPVLPIYQNIMNPWDERPLQIVVPTVCEPETVIVTTLETSLKVPGVELSRVDLEFSPGVDIEMTGKSMAVSREYRFWLSSGGRVHFTKMGYWIAGKGLPVLVPWAISILSVTATMLNSMYERRREIDTLSSIGLNPRHIAGVFLGEASIIGVVGGGLGYLLGLGWYLLMARLSLAPVVGQKVSALWSLAALGIAVTSVVFGSLIALKTSANLTPSLKRRWRQEGQANGTEGAWETRLPLILEGENLEEFVKYLLDCLSAHKELDATPTIGLIRRKGLEEGGVGISFVYNEPQASLGLYRTINTITISKAPSFDRLLLFVTLISQGGEEAANRTGLFVRGLVIKWSTEKARSG